MIVHTSVDDVLKNMLRDVCAHYKQMEAELEDGIAKLEKYRDETGTQFPMLHHYHRALACVREQLYKLEDTNES